MTTLGLWLGACGAPPNPAVSDADIASAIGDLGDAAPLDLLPDGSENPAELPDTDSPGDLPEVGLDGIDVAPTDVDVTIAPDSAKDALDGDGSDSNGTCAGTPGCACTADSECSSAICADTPAGKLCASLCTSECPAGFSCRSTNTGGKQISYCAAQGVSQCAPCLTNADCNADYAVPALCLSGGAAGSFCVGTCATAADCGPGTVCTAAPGTAAKVCLPPGGVQECTCSAWAVANVASTSCEAVLGKQLCPGKRTCTAAGLSQCEQTPSSPCVDTVCKGSKNGSLCNDGDGCTTNSTCQNGLCAGGKNICECQQDSDCAGKNDANLCNGSLFCALETNTCELDPDSVVDCSATKHGPCEAATCEPATGKCLIVPGKDGGACEDDDPCTVNACQGGQCVVQEQLCACQTTADCKNDGDLCNGTLYCDKAVFPYTCKVNPASIKTCPASDDPCLAPLCNKADGSCGWTAGADGVPCEDGSQCTSGDACLGGACASGALTCSCTTQADCLSQDDGNFCNGVPFCNLAAGKCQINPASVVTCPSANDTQCEVNRCQAKSGQCAMQDRVDGAVCDDDNPCTANESCQSGKCQATADICECKQDGDCPDDGNACNGVFFCNLTSNLCQINPATVVQCDPGSAVCAPIQCDPATGACVPTPAPNTTACDDGEACTALGTCQDGACTAGANLCQCDVDADCVQYENGDLCDGTLYCDKTKNACVVNQATLVFCDPSTNTNCLRNRCQPKTGQCAMTAVKSGVQCEDGNPCTANDKCQEGSCETGLTICLCQTDDDCVKYDDGNLCNGTFYCSQAGLQSTCVFNPNSAVTCDQSLAPVCNSLTCAPATGVCNVVPKAGPCEDGSTCTLADQCVGGKCLAGQQQACDDSDPCTFDLCISGSGCTFTPTPDGPCNDGEVCTKNDRCTAGSCGGEAVVCADNEACLAFACISGVGCQGSPANGSCNDDNPCTIKDVCSAGSCNGESVQCNDDRACTDDYCSSNGTCQFLNNTEQCEDGDYCTAGDSCNDGACEPGAAPDCSDGTVCTLDSCSPLVGCTFTLITGNCVDDNACTESETCQEDGSCDGPLKGCGDGNPCELWVCDPASGCVNVGNSTAACDDGSACTSGDLCSDGECVGGPTLDCDDGNPDSTDTCTAAGGCLHTYIETCDGADNDLDGSTDDVSCEGSCSCSANGEATCPDSCTTCPDPADIAVQVDDGNNQVTICAHDFAALGASSVDGSGLNETPMQTVLDSQSGLEWRKTVGFSGTLADAKVYCDELDGFGLQDWRVPTMFELTSLVDYTSPSGAVMAGAFGTQQNVSFHSLTPAPAMPGSYFRLKATGGVLSEQSAPGMTPAAVRCVRSTQNGGAQTPVSSPGRFVVAASLDIVTDRATGLYWQRQPPTTTGNGAGGYDLAAAAQYCKDLDASGTGPGPYLPGSGWRLPTVRELQSLLDRQAATGPRINSWAFPDTPVDTVDRYWTSTALLDGANNKYWAVSFVTTTTANYDQSETLRVRCVR